MSISALLSMHRHFTIFLFFHTDLYPFINKKKIKELVQNVVIGCINNRIGLRIQLSKKHVHRLVITENNDVPTDHFRGPKIEIPTRTCNRFYPYCLLTIRSVWSCIREYGNEPENQMRNFSTKIQKYNE